MRVAWQSEDESARSAISSSRAIRAARIAKTTEADLSSVHFFTLCVGELKGAVQRPPAAFHKPVRRGTPRCRAFGCTRLIVDLGDIRESGLHELLLRLTLGFGEAQNEAIYDRQLWSTMLHMGRKSTGLAICVPWYFHHLACR